MKIINILFLFFLLTPLCFSKTLKSFSLPSYLDQNEYRYHYGKKTVINFWATWCISCIKEIPVLEKLKRENSGVEFLAINAGDSRKKIKKFLKKTGFSYRILMDGSKDFSKGLNIFSLPQTIVVDRNGVIIYHKNIPPKLR